MLNILQNITVILCPLHINTLRPRQDGSFFVHDIFTCISLNGKFRILNTIFSEICSLRSNWQCGSIGSDSGLAPNRRQAIIWTNVGMLYWYAPLVLSELTPERHGHQFADNIFKFIIFNKDLFRLKFYWVLFLEIQLFLKIQLAFTYVNGLV